MPPPTPPLELHPPSTIHHPSSPILDRWCERGILALTLLILVSMPLAFGGQPQPPASFPLGFLLLDPFVAAQWLMVPVLALWLARLWLNPKPRLLWPPVCWAVLAFVLYALARYLRADIEYLARLELLRILVYGFLFFVILNNLHRQESAQLITFTLVFLAMAVSFYAAFQFFTGSDRVWHLFRPYYHHRGSGTYICPNNLGGFLELLLPLALAYAVVSRLKPVLRILLGYAALVILAGIGATVSRGSWLSSGVALLCFFGVLLFHRHYRLPSFLLLVLLVAAGFYFLPKSFFIQSRFRQLVSQEGKIDDDARFALWRPAFRVWEDAPWFGAGPAHFDYRYRAYRPESVQGRAVFVHNDYLNALVDYGLVGALLIASVLLLLALGLRKTWRAVRGPPSDLGHQRGSNKFAFVLGASLGLLALLVHSLVDFNMHIPANALVAVALMALLSAHLRFATDRYWVGSNFWVTASLTLALLAGGVSLAWQSSRHVGEQFWLAQAARTLELSKAQVDCLTRAATLEPGNPETAYTIAEALRRQSQEGADFYQDQQQGDYRQLARQAMDWFGRGMKLNPLDPRNFCGYGWCLDWLGKLQESAPFFDRAEQLDPNGYFTLNKIGLHYLETGDFAAARPWFERSLRLEHEDPTIAQSYLALANRRLLEAATNEISAKINFPAP
ncbi:MAG TPA: O-antigen ligase family protein [Candidatus Binatia bacterium]|jgi:O-antigen ligase|nr:O-antigen ligase family protein [Candidatus Binatia bacterium]